MQTKPSSDRSYLRHYGYLGAPPVFRLENTYKPGYVDCGRHSKFTGFFDCDSDFGSVRDSQGNISLSLKRTLFCDPLVPMNKMWPHYAHKELYINANPFYEELEKIHRLLPYGILPITADACPIISIPTYSNLYDRQHIVPGYFVKCVYVRHTGGPKPDRLDRKTASLRAIDRVRELMSAGKYHATIRGHWVIDELPLGATNTHDTTRIVRYLADSVVLTEIDIAYSNSN